MSLLIDFFDETEEVKEEYVNMICDLLEQAARMENVEDGTELSVTFVDNERIQEINRDYRDKDQPTDVISFAMEDMGEGEMEIVGAEMPRMLGDLIISIPRAKEQAEEYGHSFDRELGFLALHGFLHLLGYDHMTDEDEKEMFGKQKEILEAFGLDR
ncbi:rRNA maturation RNase YbeY [Bacillus pseudomycoides]|uniref:rRNA maturation RNase YbeY n=1 Tax=Bacillus pseudomycoides TaxID=64104 RepID=UPI000BF23705|nr:rRNA maturation RNase YbeY [Bacillus pseudomycoides]MBD5798695.1 rRNA maturation RNase YbeY [Bacillus pseudomycoides]MCR8856979.1 rRNA maturation RNase YbeY [Bacillus pseudomycoides]MED1474278.1 rRNA maturation RNase YbeY [Bacillus pseudomycoides]PEJ25644.1 rRNA maturation RNase YbeY [Bacillus pseudomycoides]PEO90742.1 rRNA maturation RNase YbeY [Bacillus pseudomycoides]